MNQYRDFPNVVQKQWTGELSSRMTCPDAIMRLMLLKSDLESLRIALEDYLAARHEVNAAMATSHKKGRTHVSAAVARSRMFHHGKVFVVCMMRFARLLEAAKANKHEYPQDVGDAITLAWKTTRSFYNDYREARNAIEHIDGEVNGYNRKFINLLDDSLEVVDGKRARIIPTAFQTVERAWARIEEAIMLPAKARASVRRAVLMKRLMLVLQARVEHLRTLA